MPFTREAKEVLMRIIGKINQSFTVDEIRQVGEDKFVTLVPSKWEDREGLEFVSPLLPVSDDENGIAQVYARKVIAELNPLGIMVGVVDSRTAGQCRIDINHKGELQVIKRELYPAQIAKIAHLLPGMGNHNNLTLYVITAKDGEKWGYIDMPTSGPMTPTLLQKAQISGTRIVSVPPKDMQILGFKGPTAAPPASGPAPS